MAEIQEFLRTTKVECFKYNYALDDFVQNYKCYSSYIHLNQELDYLTIITRKPKDDAKYVIDVNPEEV